MFAPGFFGPSTARSDRSRRDVQFDASLTLQIANDTKQVARLWIAAGAEHPDKAFRRRAGRLAQLPETDCCLDSVPYREAHPNSA